MGFLNKLFGGGTSLEGLRKAVEQKRFADARVMAEELQEQSLPENEMAEVEQLGIVAGDGLAKLNFEEALGFQRAGDYARATEHLQLAIDQVCSPELRKEIEGASIEEMTPVVDHQPESKGHGGSCSSCGPQEMEEISEEDIEFPDLESQVELIMTSYPPEIADRYRQKSEQFMQAFLLSHSGQDEEALEYWQKVPQNEQDDLYWFEYGSSQARNGNPKMGRKNLERALQLNPGMLPAVELLIQIQVGTGATDEALTHLKKMLEKNQSPAFCNAQLALIYMQKKQFDQALEHATQAIDLGVADANFFQMTASLLEKAGKLDEAEKLLKRIPAGGGCSGGGLSLPLAEFLLRQKRDLAKVLDTFNAACRQDPQNPRWQLRAAQTYIARNWTREGLELLKKVVHDPQLEPELKQEAEQLLASQQA